MCHVTISKTVQESLKLRLEQVIVVILLVRTVDGAKAVTIESTLDLVLLALAAVFARRERDECVCPRERATALAAARDRRSYSIRGVSAIPGPPHRCQPTRATVLYIQKARSASVNQFA